MSNDATRARSEALPIPDLTKPDIAKAAASLSRRLFLRGSALAGASLTTGATVAVAAAQPGENPELMRIVTRLAQNEADQDAAYVEKENVRVRYEAIAPKMPDEFRAIGCHHHLRLAADSERDCFGEKVRTKDWSQQAMVVRASQFEYHFADALAPSRGRPSNSVKKLRQFYARLQAYEAQVEAARMKAGCDAILFGIHALESEMTKLANAMALKRAWTGQGLAAKALAYQHYRRCEERARNHYPTYVDRHAAEDLAANALALFGPAAS